MTTRTVYFDPKKGGANSRGKWMTVIRDGDGVKLAEHNCEFAARLSIGLTGGSKDPFYEPPNGQTGGETVESRS